jgi:hypothetical protein
VYDVDKTRKFSMFSMFSMFSIILWIPMEETGWFRERNEKIRKETMNKTRNARTAVFFREANVS